MQFDSPDSTRLLRVGKEQLLAIDLVAGDRGLAFRRDQPVDEGLARVLFQRREFFGFDKHDAVLIEQPLVALDRYFEIAAVLERDPGAAVGQYITVHGTCGVERRPHALPDLAIPGAFAGLDIDTGLLPEREFGRVRA